MLAIVHRVIAGWLAEQTGIDRASAQCGAVTLIQRFGSALNLNIHFHMLWLDGVYDANDERPQRKPRLHRARAPSSAQLTELVGRIAHRVCRHLARRGWLEGEDESVFLSDSAGSDDGMDGLRMSSITYRIATGRDAGRKVITLQTLPGDAGSLEADAGRVGGFSLHAGVAAEVHESHKLEKLCRYRHHPCRMGCGGLHRETGSAGPAATRPPDPIPRRIRPERRPARAADAVGAGKAACDRCRTG